MPETDVIETYPLFGKGFDYAEQIVKGLLSGHPYIAAKVENLGWMGFYFEKPVPGKRNQWIARAIEDNVEVNMTRINAIYGVLSEDEQDFNAWYQVWSAMGHDTFSNEFDQAVYEKRRKKELNRQLTSDILVEKLQGIEDLTVTVQANAFYSSPIQGHAQGHMGHSGPAGDKSESDEERCKRYLSSIISQLLDTIKHQDALNKYEMDKLSKSGGEWNPVEVCARPYSDSGSRSDDTRIFISCPICDCRWVEIDGEPKFCPECGKHVRVKPWVLPAPNAVDILKDKSKVVAGKWRTPAEAFFAHQYYKTQELRDILLRGWWRQAIEWLDRNEFQKIIRATKLSGSTRMTALEVVHDSGFGRHKFILGHDMDEAAWQIFEWDEDSLYASGICVTENDSREWVTVERA